MGREGWRLARSGALSAMRLVAYRVSAILASHGYGVVLRRARGDASHPARIFLRGLQIRVAGEGTGEAESRRAKLAEGTLALKCLTKRSEHDLGPAVEADGRRDGADAARDKNAGNRSLHKTARVFFSVKRRHNRRADQREIHLTAVRVAAECKADAFVADLFDVVGIVREQNDCVVIRRIGECHGQILHVAPKIADAAKAQARAILLEPDAGIRHLG